MATASRIRGKAAFLEEGGVYLALLGECACGAQLGMIVDAAHLRDNATPPTPAASISPHAGFRTDPAVAILNIELQSGIDLVVQKGKWNSTFGPQRGAVQANAQNPTLLIGFVTTSATRGHHEQVSFQSSFASRVDSQCPARNQGTPSRSAPAFVAEASPPLTFGFNTDVVERGDDATAGKCSLASNSSPRTGPQQCCFRRSTPPVGPTQREQPATCTCGKRFSPQRKNARRISPPARKRSSGDRELDGRTANSSQAPAAYTATGQNAYPDILRRRGGPNGLIGSQLSSIEQFRKAFRQEFLPVDYERRMRRELEQRTQHPDESLLEFVRAMRELFELEKPSAPNAERVERVSGQSHPIFAAYLRGAGFKGTADPWRHSGRTSVSSPTVSVSGTRAALRVKGDSASRNRGREAAHYADERGRNAYDISDRALGPYSYGRRAAETAPQFNRRDRNTELPTPREETRPKCPYTQDERRGAHRNPRQDPRRVTQQQPRFPTDGKRAKPPITSLVANCGTEQETLLPSAYSRHASAIHSPDDSHGGLRTDPAVAVLNIKLRSGIDLVVQ
ncbi:hypothetical protein HPB47_021115 [Ixodes persulcatus]|uniref:Uncharacterized protein n=1 Tax=Ixodes persulcatus TaxID=34615 RepID=A0AC60QEC2_IXOPE|nr:hypothetical protein HPB47_021115 [Ixodes persulcatus]